MKYLRFITIGLLFFQMNTINAQDLSSHQWENRLLLVKFNDSNNSIYQKQLAEFHKNLKGLEERKIIVYLVKKDSFKKGLSNNQPWTPLQDNLTSEYFKYSDADFEIVLVGLDGGVKLNEPELLKAKKLFSIIDVMPMRRQEMRNED